MGVHSKWTETAALGALHTPVVWSRPSWRPTGRAARLAFVVVGAFPDGPSLRLEKSVIESPLGAALQARLLTRESNAAFVGTWSSGATGGLLHDQLGAEAEARVAAAPAVVFIQAEVPDPRDLGYLRDAMQIVSRSMNEHTVAVFDMYAAHWLTPEFVRQAATAPGFRVRDHLHTAAANEERYAPGLWMHSRGAIKLGRPEAEIRHIRADARALKAAALVLEGALKLLAEGLEPADGGNYALPGFQNHFTVITSPDDSQDARHFMNRSVELRDCNALTGKSEPDLRELLAEAEQKVRA